MVMSERTLRRIQAAAVAVALVGAVVLPFVLSPYRVYQGSMVGVFLVAIAGLALITGAAGQVTLGHSFFFALGAFTSAYMITAQGMPEFLTVVLAGLVGLATGWIFGVPALRLRGLYLAIVTLSLAVVAPPLARRLEWFTGGVSGTSVGPAESPPGLASDQWLYLQVLVTVVVVLAVAWALLRSPFGRAMRAVRDNEVAAAASGVDVARVKTSAFALASMLAGIGGALYTLVVRYVAPDSFTMLLSVMMLAALVVGGMRSLLGVVLGAVFLQFVPVWSSEINQALTGLTFGVLLILLVTFLPLGLSGLITALVHRAVRRLGDTSSRRGGSGDPAVPVVEPAGEGIVAPTPSPRQDESART